jgi:hypothetical protein
MPGREMGEQRTAGQHGVIEMRGYHQHARGGVV